MFSDPEVSIATGMNRCVSAMFLYFRVFCLAALSAALAALTKVSGRLEAAKVSAMVTSHVADRPCFHCISVTRSGFLPSVRMRP